MEASRVNIPSYLALSIFNMLCCCLPLGIAALVFSVQVKNATHIGDVNQASKSSRTARLLNIIGIVVGAITLIILIVIFAVVLKKK
ncbi:synapse differentiation-inducing gene protein 1-like [Rhineura floridana]|uniref:synapse differentiation-inducing gene protein 1-like n=1 Tax=Rhineura floridana TaxID=261503 RepID=UPI002AC852FB|nr:synapse differentiation-inducing gene protein 1-like [Rhineura floridana]